MKSNVQLKSVTILAASLLTGFVVFPIAAAADSAAHVDYSVSNPQPPYPDSAQLNGEQGTIVINVHVRASGKPDKVAISQSSGYRDLDTAAEEGVLNWHYLPAMEGGDPASDWTTVKVVYQLPTLVPAPTPASANSH
jgi:protein TonB